MECWRRLRGRSSLQQARRKSGGELCADLLAGVKRRPSQVFFPGWMPFYLFAKQCGLGA